LLQALLKLVCQKEGVVPRLVATPEDLYSLAQKDPPASLPLLGGWRYDIFGKHALALKSGSLALTLEKGELSFLPVPPQEKK
jgi:ribonuclease D